MFLTSHQNAAQRVLDGMNYMIQSVSEYSTGPTKAVTAWLTDQVAPPYWRPNTEITVSMKSWSREQTLQNRKQGLLLWFTSVLWEIMKQNTQKFDIFEKTVHIMPALDYYHVFPSITGSSSPRQACHGCEKVFAEAERKHHCRSCGEGFCHPCSSHRMPVPERGWGSGPVRVCKACYRQGGPADTNSQGETPPTNQWMYRKWS